MSAAFILDPTTGLYVLVDDTSFSTSTAFTVTTDQPDYSPLSTATFTVDGVNAGDIVTLEVTDLNGLAISGTNQPWTIVASASGTLETTWAVGADAANQAFQLTVIDRTTGMETTTTFTDSTEPTQFDYSATHVDLTTTGLQQTVGGVVFANVGTTIDTNTASSGTGQFGTFVEVQNNGAEQGYNTNANNTLDTKNSNVFNHPLQLSDLQAVDATGAPTAGGAYYEFRLDIHQSNSKPYISLDDVQLWQSSNSALADFTAGPSTSGMAPSFTFNSGATQVYDLNSSVNETGNLPNSILLNSTYTAGSGGGADLVMLVPTADFNASNGNYVYLYSAFGYQGGGWSANSTYEKWGALLNTSTTGGSYSANVEKLVSGDGGTTWWVLPDDSGSESSTDIGYINAATGLTLGTSLFEGTPTLLSGHNPLYEFVVTNTGNAPLTNVTLGDSPALAGLGNIGTLVEGGSVVVGPNAGTTGTWAPGSNSDTVTVASDQAPPDSDTAAYYGVTPGVTIDKQVSGNNSAWLDVGNGNLSDVPVILAAGQSGSLGSKVYFQAIVTNTTDQSLDMTGTSVTDANPSDTFAGATTVSVGTPQTYTLTETAQTGTQTDTATVNGTVSDSFGNSTGVTASDQANYFGATAGVTLDKQISGNGSTWLDQGIGNLSDVPVILAAGQSGLLGSQVYFQAIATNTSNGGLEVTDVSVTDASPSGTFAGPTNISTNATYTLTTTAQTGTQTDTATVNGTVSDSFGNSTGVTASDQANYFGATAGVTLDKQISGFANPGAHSGVNGGEWYDIGGSLNAPVILTGFNVYFQAVATNTSNGGLGVTGVSVTDTNPTGTFAGPTSISTNATYTLSTTALAGIQTDTAIVNGTVSDSFGNHTTVTAQDSANYFGATPGINVEKLVSVDGGADWYFTQVPGDTYDTVAYISSVTGINAANLHIGTPATIAGANVEFEVVVTDTSNTNDTLNETFAVTDNVYGSFTFSSNSLSDGGHIVSNVLNETAGTGAGITDIATANGTVTDLFGNTAHPTDTDSASYTGLALGTAGLTQGFWANHSAAWDGKSDVTWGNIVDKAGGLWGDAFTASTVAVTQQGNKFTGNDDILYGLTGHGGGGVTGDVLLGDANGNGAINTGEVTTLLTNAQASGDLTASAGGNAQTIMLSQLVAAQLNIYNGDQDPGSSNLGASNAGHDLVGEGVLWLQGLLPGEGGVPSSTSGAQWTSKFFDTGIANPNNPGHDIMASGQDLKNVLQAFNQDQIVTSKDGSLIGWSDNGGVTVVGVHANTTDEFWLVALQHGVISG